MEDDLGTCGCEDRADRLPIAYVGNLQGGARAERMLQVRPPAAREVVDHGDRVAAGEQAVDEVRSDEAGAAGDHAVHAAASLEAVARGVRATWAPRARPTVRRRAPGRQVSATRQADTSSSDRARTA